MISRNEGLSAGQWIDLAMAESQSRDFQSLQPQRPEGLSKGNLAEGYDDPDVCQQVELPQKVRTAVFDLFRQGFIPRRGATDRCRNVTIFESEFVVPTGRIRLVGIAEPVEGSEEPLPAPVSCEHPSRPISTFGRRSEPNDQDPGIQVAETREGFGPVFPVAESPGFVQGELSEVGDQPRAFPAPNDPLLQLFEFFP